MQPNNPKGFNVGLVDKDIKTMRSILTKIQILSFLCALPALANDVGLHNSSAQPTRAATQREHALGVCELVSLTGSAQADLSPMVYVNNFYFNDAKIDYATAIISTLQQPKHGHLESDSDGNWAGAKYLPNEGYLGNDSFVMQVEGNGYTVKLQYFVAVASDDTKAAFNLNSSCTGSYWKISTALDLNGSSLRRLG
jgi:hypothetical protein